MKKLPGFLQRYFWDADFRGLDENIYRDFIIGRILEYGDEKATNWLFKNFEKSKIEKTLAKKRGISPFSANYWRLIFNIPKNKILCLQKRSQNKLERTWLY